MLLASDRHHHLLEVANIVAAWGLSLETAGVIRPNLQSPLTDSLVGDENATLHKHVLNQPQAQWTPEIEAYDSGDDLGWKAMAYAADGFDHGSLSLASPSYSGYYDNIGEVCFGYGKWRHD
jgi:hypothetical protein